MSEIILNRHQYLELEKLAWGAFAPLSGFMNEDDFVSVVETMRLTDGSVFSIPIVLDLSPEEARRIKGRPRVALVFENEEVGEFSPESVFSCSKPDVAPKVYGCDDPKHPGIANFYHMGDVFVGGTVTLKKRVSLDISEFELTPEETKKIFAERGWSSVAAFHTRNAPHRGHEWLQRAALECCDGLFIQPLLGRKKPGDFTPEAIMKGYRVLIDGFYPASKVVLGALSTFGRYAGPREAVFHALVRRNYGATHIVIGRDHAGVETYYQKYESQALCLRLEAELGIAILRLHGPHYCAICDGLVTDKTCPHSTTDPDAITEVNGTDVRALLANGTKPPPHIMRPEVLSALDRINLFEQQPDPLDAAVS